MAPQAIQPDVHITVALPGAGPCDLTLSYPLHPNHDALLHQMHELGVDKGTIECRMHDGDYRLRDLRDADGRVRGAWLYLRRHSGDPNRLVLCHWPEGGVTGSHTVPSRMTPEHRAGQEYIALRGESAGYEVELEKSIAAGTRSDVVVRGAFTLAAEVQVSGISVASVMRRTNSATAAGACTTWFAGERIPPWAFKAPTVQTNRPTGMQPGGWTVTTGPRLLEWEHCGPGSRLGRCPDNRRSWCGKRHPLWRPMAGITVDHIVERVPAGDLVRLDTGVRQGSILTTPSDKNRWEEYVGAPKVPVQRRGSRSSGLRHNNYSPEKLRSRIAGGRGEPSPLDVPAPRTWVMPDPLATSIYTTRASYDPDGQVRRNADRFGHEWPITGYACANCNRSLIPCYPNQQFHPECDPDAATWTDAQFAQWTRARRTRQLTEQGRQISEDLIRKTGRK